MILQYFVIFLGILATQLWMMFWMSKAADLNTHDIPAAVYYIIGWLPSIAIAAALIMAVLKLYE